MRMAFQACLPRCRAGATAAAQAVWVGRSMGNIGNIGRLLSTSTAACKAAAAPPRPTPLPEYQDLVLGQESEHAARRKADPAARFVVSGSSRGIGLALTKLLLETTRGAVLCLGRNPAHSAELQALAARYGADRLHLVPVDLRDPASISTAAAAVSAATEGRVDVLLNVAGMLGNGTSDPGPERTVRKLDPAWMRETFELNLFGHVQMTSELFNSGCLRVGRKLDKRPASVVASLSARVGSIGDNGLGGWYSYRMSKTALNQFTKCLSIETKRDNCFPISLHPGTVATNLSVPFQRNVPEGKLFDADFSAMRLLQAVDTVGEEQAGGFYDWDGKAIPW